MKHNMQIFDGHNDTFTKIFEADGKSGIKQFLGGNAPLDLDLPRMKQASFVGGLFSICVPGNIEDDHSRKDNLTITEHGYAVRMASPVPHSEAHDFTNRVISLMKEAQQQSAGQFTIVKDYRQLESSIANDSIAAVLHFEGAEAIAENLADLQAYYDVGLRSLGLVWSRPNAFGEGVPFKFPVSPDTGPGLTAAGKRLVRTCNDMGIVVDLSHINEKGFWDVAVLSNKPLVASHTAVHAISPSTRNLTDKQIDAIGSSDGIIGVYFEAANLRRDGALNPNTPLALLAEHIVYLIERAGIDHVGFGSDYDGAVVINELHDVTGVPKLVNALRIHGLSEADLQKLTHGNWLRVLQKTWQA